jgi:hypothetical protein
MQKIYIETYDWKKKFVWLYDEIEWGLQIKKTKRHILWKYGAYWFNKTMINQLPLETKIWCLTDWEHDYETTIKDIREFGQIVCFPWLDPQYIYPIKMFNVK